MSCKSSRQRRPSRRSRAARPGATTRKPVIPRRARRRSRLGGRAGRSDGSDGMRPKIRSAQAPGRFRAALLAVLAVSGLPGAVQGQPGARLPVDRVVAVVGDSAVLLSQLLQRANELRSQGEPVPEEGDPARDEFLREQLEDLVNHQIVLQSAAADTLLAVEEAAVEEAVEEHLGQVQGNYGSRADMERALRREGLTMQGYREMLREQVRQQKLVELYLRMNMGGTAVEVSEDEMRAVFEAGRETLQERPATITFLQAVMSVAPADSAKSAARATADSLLARLRAGEDFAELARARSQDPGSAPAGGDLGWFRRDGAFVEEFEDAAFSLLEGQISEVVETTFGYHLVRIDQVRFAERRARHILVVPATEPADLARARDLAGEVAAQAREGRDFREIVAEHHDPLVFPFRADSATVPRNQVAQMLPPAYLAPLGGERTSGDVLGPIQFSYRDRQHFAVLYILGTREAGAFEFEDLRADIRASLIQQKRFSTLLEGLRAKTYVEIKSN